MRETVSSFVIAKYSRTSWKALFGEECISVQYEVIQHCGVEFDCVKSFSFSGNDDEKKALIVFLSGAAKREERTIPLFHRWSWQESLKDYHTAFISDPTLKLDDNLILGWYTGNEEVDYTKSLSNLILSWCLSLNLNLNQVVIVGSSGGGFAALHLASLLPGVTAFVENPQTVTTEYLRQEVEEHLRVCFPNMTPAKEKKNFRLSVMKRIDMQNFYPRFYYSQNLRDGFHVRNHYRPFLEHFKQNSNHTAFKQKFLLYYSDKGHNGVRSKDEFLIDLESCLRWSQNIGLEKNCAFIDCRGKPKLRLNAEMRANATKRGSKYGMFTVIFVTEDGDTIHQNETQLRYSPSAGWFKYIEAKTSSFTASASCTIPSNIDAVMIRFRGWGEFPIEFDGEITHTLTEI